MSKLIEQIIEEFKESRRIGTSKARDKLRGRDDLGLTDNFLRSFGQGTYSYLSPIIGTYDFLKYGPRNPKTGLRKYTERTQ